MTTANLGSDRPLIFQHIPKTAGVSARSVMSCNFHVNEILHVPDPYWMDARFAADAVSKYRFIHGHVHFEFLREQVDSARLVTFLRDPVERVLSLYFFLRKQDPENQANPNLRVTVELARSLTMAEFIGHSDPVIASMVRNYQLSVLLDTAQEARPSNTWVASALDNLEKYQFVGIADPDLMQQSILLLNQTFGWSSGGGATARKSYATFHQRRRAAVGSRTDCGAKRIGDRTLRERPQTPPQAIRLAERGQRPRSRAA